MCLRLKRYAIIDKKITEETYAREDGKRVKATGRQKGFKRQETKRIHIRHNA